VWRHRRGRNLSYHPQQSDLNPQAGQRHTACIRYASAPQRSHNVLTPAAGGVLRADLIGVIGRTTACGWSESGMAGIIVTPSANYLRLSAALKPFPLISSR